MTQSIYLDNASTTPIAPEIADLLSELFRRFGANPASQHRAGRAAHAALEDAKDRIKLALLGKEMGPGTLDSWRVVITSGGTESNNLALNGLGQPDSPIFISAVEHPSILGPATSLPHLRSRSRLIDIKKNSFELNIDALEENLIRCAARSVQPVVSVMLGNNETGLLSNIPAISAVCRRYGAILHSDCVQAVGKLAPAEYAPHVDAITISGHKLHGPVGVGALVLRSSLSLRPLLYGGSQQLELRPGTESVPLTTALALAIELAQNYRQSGQISYLSQLRNHFETRLLEGARHLSSVVSPSSPFGASHLTAASTNSHPHPNPCVIGSSHPRLPHISSIAFPGRDRQALLMALDLAGVQCSSGSACASGSSQPSHVLTALDLPDDWIASALRFSFSRYTTLEEVDQAVARILALLRRSN